jgi:hypothetical protein
MDMPEVSPRKSWTTRRERKKRRLMRVASHCDSRVIHTEKMIEAMEELLEPGDQFVSRVIIKNKRTFFLECWRKWTPREFIVCTF